MELTYAELFAGAGGLSRGLEAAGFHCVAHAEIEPHARAVLRYRWPDTRLDGDVTQINGADYAGVTLLSGGSPCQDLSVAGKRAGLAGGRSGLFHEQCRIWNESGAPYLLWENVLGALSSNSGKDFATVLSTLVGAAIPVPADGWSSGGVAAGRDAVAAWRVLDLQHFGPPQRRVRVFVLAARAGGVDPAEVLALSEGVCGHPSPRQQSREGIAGRAAGGVGASGVMAFDSYNQSASHVTGFLSHGESGRPIAWDNGLNASTEAHGPSVARGKSGGGQNGVLAFHHTQDPISGESSPALGVTTGGMGVVQTLVVGGRDKGPGDSYDNTPITVQCVTGDVAPAIGRTTDGMGVIDASTFVERAGKLRAWGPVVPTLQAGTGETGNLLPKVVCTTGDITHALTHEGADASEDGTGRGTPIVARMVAFGEYATDGTASTIKQRDYKDATDLVIGGRPRRLTPRECEALMSWPTNWTQYGRKDDGTVYELSDTARYRLCGNGVGSVCVEWIAQRLVEAIAMQNGLPMQEAA